jgi:hypothetical protein
MRTALVAFPSITPSVTLLSHLRTVARSSLAGSFARGLRTAPVAEPWSVCGAQRSQPVATGDKCDAGETRSNKRKPLPWVATGCRGNDW